MKSTDKIMLFIPMYNCEKQISRVIKNIKPEHQMMLAEVVIIDNRSQDNSIEIAKEHLAKFITHTKFSLLQNKKNYSLGGSVKRAFLYAIEKKYDYLISLHGDDQGDLNDAIRVIKNREHKNNIICIGARFHPQSQLMGYSKFRILGNKIFNFFWSLISSRKIYDMIAGINIYDVSYLKSEFYMKFPNNLTFDLHFLLHILTKNSKFMYFPIKWKEEDQISNAKIFRQAFIIFKMMMRFLFFKNKLFAHLKDNEEQLIKYESNIILSNE